MSKFFKQLNFIDILLKSISQIMLQENRLTGFLFLIGLFFGNWKYGVAAILAALIGNVTAIILKYNSKDISKGLYGFSAALFGVALIFFFKHTLIIWLLVVAGSALACILQNFFIKQNFPAYTFPFVLVTWLFVFLIRSFTEIPPSNTFTKTFSMAEFDIIAFGFRGFSQVVFQGGLISGFLFFIAVFISSRSAALYALVAVFVTGFMAHLIGQPTNIIFTGVWGFNAVLSAIVFSGTHKSNFVWVAVAIILTFLINFILVKSEILDPFGGILTFAFVLGTWITLLLKEIKGSTQRAQIGEKTKRAQRGYQKT